MSTTQELLAKAKAALDERIAKARAGGVKLTVKADKVFVVTNGSGHAYEVSFLQAPTGVCACEDFMARGKYLHACKHTAVAVLTQWPDNFDRWEAKVRSMAEASVRALPADPEPPPVPETAPTPEPAAITTAPAAMTQELVTAVIEAAMPLLMALVMDALAASVSTIVQQTVAIVNKSQEVAA